MAVLSDLRASTLLAIREVSADSHFSSSQLNGFINESLRQIAPKIHFPRKPDSGTQVTAGTATYDAASDFVYLIDAYFGDETIDDDKRPLDIIRLETIKHIRPGWLTRTVASRGRPERIILQDRNTFILDPVPSAAESATGKKLWLWYVYTPATLSADGDTPDIPTDYHDAIPYYAGHLAMLSLENQQFSAFLLNKFDKMVAEMHPTEDQEVKQAPKFEWGFGNF